MDAEPVAFTPTTATKTRTTRKMTEKWIEFILLMAAAGVVAVSWEMSDGEIVVGLFFNPSVLYKVASLFDRVFFILPSTPDLGSSQQIRCFLCEDTVVN